MSEDSPITSLVNRVLRCEDPAGSAAKMREHADRCVAAHKRLLTEYPGPTPKFLADGLVDGVSCAAMMFLLVAEAVTALLPAKSATADEVDAIFIASARRGELQARARVLVVETAEEKDDER